MCGHVCEGKTHFGNWITQRKQFCLTRGSVDLLKTFFFFFLSLGLFQTSTWGLQSWGCLCLWIPLRCQEQIVQEDQDMGHAHELCEISPSRGAATCCPRCFHVCQAWPGDIFIYRQWQFCGQGEMAFCFLGFNMALLYLIKLYTHTEREFFYFQDFSCVSSDPNGKSASRWIKFILDVCIFCYAISQSLYFFYAFLYT